MPPLRPRWVALLLAALAGQSGAAPPDCPAWCAYNSKARNGGCGVVTKLPNGTQGYVCPQALAFSVGFDSDIVLQRAPAKAAVYGQLVGDGDGASVSVTVSQVGGGSYTVKALVAPAPTFCLPIDPNHPTNGCAANYSAVWKAFLKPAPAGGEYTITAVCTGCGTGDGRARSTSSISRVTMGDVYICAGQSNMALSNIHSYSANGLKEQMMSGKFSKFRWFQYESMGGGKSGTRYSPHWTRQDGASSYQVSGETAKRTWFNASFGAALSPLGHADSQPFLAFSAACTEFGRNLLEMLGDDAPPIGLIQSAVRFQPALQDLLALPPPVPLFYAWQLCGRCADSVHACACVCARARVCVCVCLFGE